MLQVQQVRLVQQVPLAWQVLVGPQVLQALQVLARAGLLGGLGVACLFLLVSITPTSDVRDQFPQFFVGV